jgi:hypothetical protein
MPLHCNYYGNIALKSRDDGNSIVYYCGKKILTLAPGCVTALPANVKLE